MNPDPYELEFRTTVATPPERLRQRLVESVVGPAPAEDRELQILDNGPARYASRFRSGPVEQLRVAEWATPAEAQGATEHSIDGRVRLIARYSIQLAPTFGGTQVTVRYTLTTPFQGLALSFRLGRRHALARRLAGAWLLLPSLDAWKKIEVVRSGVVRPAGGTAGPAA